MPAAEKSAAGKVVFKAYSSKRLQKGFARTEALLKPL